jgi:orotidine-5'-phosphate decarboxylase
MTRLQLIEQIRMKGTYLCVGLDTDRDKLPMHLRDHPDGVVEFNRQIIEATKDYCVAYKINTAFYEAEGVAGWDALQRTAELLPSTHLSIADAKRGDIGNTSAQYAKAFFDTLGFDAVTVAPYMGEDSIRPFLEHTDKWTIVLGLTSNAGARDFELQRVLHETENFDEGIHVIHHNTSYLYETVVRKAISWGSPENMMLVTGATQSAELSNLRQLAPHHFFLVPGIGAQGGSLKEVTEKAMTADCGLLVNASRAIIYASSGEDFASAASLAAQTYASEMRTYL